MPQVWLCSDLAELPIDKIGRIIVVTVNLASSQVLSSWLKEKFSINVAAGHTRKRKSPSDPVFQVELNEDLQRTALLAKLDLSLTLKDIPMIRKSVISYICEQIHEDTVLCFFDCSNDSFSFAGFLAMIIIICLRDDVLTHWVADNTLANFQIDNDRTNCVRISFSRGESHIANTQREEECCSTIAHVVTALTQKLPFLHLTKDIMTFLQRIIFTIVKDKHYFSGLKRLHQAVHTQLASVDIVPPSHSPESANRVPSEPPVGSGWRVFEYFSGIGGMRLGLPDQIQGLPITSITAFDCSTIANQVYEHNFHSRPDVLRRPQFIRDSKLRTCLVQHLSVADVDNKADIWTMSPPCQPFTRTRGANQLDDADNRSQGLYHLMTLLLKMKHMPRFIFVENVQGFWHSNMHKLWRQVLNKCQYRFRECLLSPDKTVGLPNSRTRYYCMARFDGSYRIAISRDISTSRSTYHREDKEEELQFMQHEYQTGEQSALNEDPPEDDSEGDDDAADDRNNDSVGDEFISAPYLLNLVTGTGEEKSAHVDVLSLGDVLGEKYSSINESAELLSQLMIPKSILQSSWASKMLSIATLKDKLTYCFTKGYGKRVDHSAGSCLYLGQKELDRNNLEEHFGELRLFHPEELLLLFGFPQEFEFPETLNMQHRWGCIGNSVNVAVVKLVMGCLFEDSIWLRLMED